MKSTLFASTLAAALTATSFGQVEVELTGQCDLTPGRFDGFGYIEWDIA